jgi:hypothetical protein
MTSNMKSEKDVKCRVILDGGRWNRHKVSQQGKLRQTVLAKPP